MYSVVMKGSLTATSSTSGLWRATRATSLPILPKPLIPILILPMAKGCCEDAETGMGDAARLSGELSRSGRGGVYVAAL